jgi:hypothetical protein
VAPCSSSNPTAVTSCRTGSGGQIATVAFIVVTVAPSGRSQLLPRPRCAHRRPALSDGSTGTDSRCSVTSTSPRPGTSAGTSAPECAAPVIAATAAGSKSGPLLVAPVKSERAF